MGSNSITKKTLGKNSFQIDSSGGTGDTYGILGGSIDGLNTIFTVSLGSYVSGSLEVQLNGQLLTQGSGEDWAETTPESGTFTLSVAPEVGDIIIVKYQYQTVTTGNADTLDGHHSTDFVTNTVAGEFENKIIDGDKNTLQNIAYSSIKSTSRSGSDTTLVTGTKGTNGNLAQWNADGDLIDSKTPPSGDIVGTTDTQTLSSKTLTSPVLQGSVNGWISANETWTYASATTITVPSGAGSKYNKGMPFKLTANSVELQGYIIGVADTVLTVCGDTLTNHAFTNNYYAPSGTVPLGFDDWFSYTPSYSASGSMTYTSVTTRKAIFKISGSEVHIILDFVGTTGGTASTAVIATLPVTAADGYNRQGVALSGADALSVGFCILGTLNVSFYNSTGGNWALAANRYCFLQTIYNY